VHSKNKAPMDADERAYVALIKSMHCIVCSAGAPSEAHEPQQGLWFLSVPLCYEDHRGPHGWHGDKSRWRVAKMTELRAINETRRAVERLRSGATVQPARPPKQRERSGSNLSSSKIIPRRAA